MTQIVLAVHGGAGNLTRKQLEYPGRRGYERGLADALRSGQRVLLKGGSALNAVTEAIVILEDNDLFNAGKGAVLCADGSIELSAAIMKGNDRTAGAMVGLKRTKNPIRAARSIMGHAHSLLFGVGADDYAQSKGLDMVPADYFSTPFRRRQWQKLKSKSNAVLDHSDDQAATGTVGAVARDRRGNLATATSTGGMVNQTPGRIGDTPIIGAGSWADNNTCAISATGTGEAFARNVFARRVADLVEIGGLAPLAAAERTLDDIRRDKGVGGCILVDAQGGLALPFNTPHMFRGWLVGDAPPQVAILADEQISID